MLKELVAVNVTPPGTSTTIVLGAALTGFRAFSASGAFTNGAACFYMLTDGSQSEWGYATLATGSPDQLTGRSVLGNTAGTTARLNFSSSSTFCYNILPSARAPYVDNTGNVYSPAYFTAGSSGAGLVQLVTGDATHPGFVQFINPTGTRIGFLGYTDGAARLVLEAENGYTGWHVLQTLLVDGVLTVNGTAQIPFTNATAVTITQSGASASAAMIKDVSNTSTYFDVFRYNGTVVGSIYTNGSATIYNTTSDYRLKVTFGLTDAAFIDSIPVHLGSFKRTPAYKFPMVLAHELAQHASYAVTGMKDAVDPETGEIIPQQVSYSMLVPALIARLQRRGREIEALEARMAQSEREMAALRTMLETR